MAQFIGDNGDGTVSFDDGFGNAVRLPKDNPMAQGLMPPVQPPQVQASAMPPPPEMAPPPMPMGPGADANMAAMNPPAAPEPAPMAPQPQAAPVKPGKPLSVKQEAAAAQGMTEQGMQMQQQGFAQEEAGVKDVADVDAKRFDAEAALIEQRQQAAAELKQKHEGERMQAEEEKRSLGNGIASAVDARKSWRMDRGRLLKQMDGGDKALGALSLIIGAFAQTMNKGQSNPAMDVLMKRIDQDAEDQRQEYDQLGENVGEAKSSYQAYMAELKDRDAAAAATKAELYQSYAEKAELLGLRSSSERVKANSVIIAGQFKQKASEAILKGADSAHQRVQQRRQLGAQYAGLAEQRRQFDLTRGDRLAAEAKQEAAARAAAESGATDIPLDRMVFDGNGKPLMTPAEAAPGGNGPPKPGKMWAPGTKEEAKESKELMAMDATTADLAAKLIEGRKKHGAEFFKSQEGRAMLSTFSSLRATTIKRWGLGAPSADDLKLTDGGIGTDDPNEWRGYEQGLIRLVEDNYAQTGRRLKTMGYPGDYRAPKFGADEIPTEKKAMAETVGALKSPQVNKYTAYSPDSKPAAEPMKWSGPAEPSRPFYERMGFESSHAAALASLRDTGDKKSAAAMADSIRGVPGKEKMVEQLDAIARM